MKSKLAVFVLLFVLSSCMTIAKVFYGVRNPKPRSGEYIQKRIDKYKLSHFPHYKMTKSDFIKFYKNTEKYGLSSSVNQVIIFNKNGYLVHPKDTITCSGEIVGFIGNFKKGDVVVDTLRFSDVFGDSIYKLYEDTEMYVPQQNKPLFVLTWATYAGRLNKNNTKLWADSVKSVFDLKEIDALFLNLDIQKSWKAK